MLFLFASNNHGSSPPTIREVQRFFKTTIYLQDQSHSQQEPLPCGRQVRGGSKTYPSTQEQLKDPSVLRHL